MKIPYKMKKEKREGRIKVIHMILFILIIVFCLCGESIVEKIINLFAK